MRTKTASARSLPALLCVMLLALIVTHPGAPAGAEASQVVPYTVVETGRTSGIREPAQVVIRDAAAWTALWRTHAGPAGKPAPAVDFGREIIIALFAGDSPAPRTLTISRIVHESDGLTVWYILRDTGPLPDGGSPSRVAPFQIVRLTRLVAPVRFMRVKTPPIVPQP